MNRLMFVDFHDAPIHGKLQIEAEPGYKGYFHYHQGIELLYVHQGDGSVILDQNVYPIEPGTLFLFQPYQLHYVKASTESATYVRSIIHFEPNTLQTALQSFGSLAVALKRIWRERLTTQVFRGFGNRHPAEPLYRYYGELLEQATPEGRLSLLAALLTQLLVFLDAEGAYPQDKSPAVSRSASHTESILEWIEKHFDKPFKLEELASDLHLSKYHVSRLFREETGHTVTDYLLARRIQEACLLLISSDRSVEEIGAKVGWPIPSHFSSQFRKWVGCTPSQYRGKQSILLQQNADTPI
ncbi:AraC family transcriptional regulator [Paenibacillus sp. LHD-117]|uniref:AraC family transcriptional regulator n=1 Tax=Paenibacillus sp. LHD-117 TaxID=3071412 RepID=UPI0027DEEB8B|nr:AraC family transcriptional regulator [Paenibacillus sp. LHD-117]MDQ6423235.1 AraC family transcriptional regulator [Paenibacillus sp. LHD-117]